MKVKSGTSDRSARRARRGPRCDRAGCCDACGDVDLHDEEYLAGRRQGVKLASVLRLLGHVGPG
eukprot:5225099-Pyramimonas_sp.AAC.1